MADYRNIFPSYHWDEDVWRVNQIVNLHHVVGAEAIGFVKAVPNEEVKRNDSTVQGWIDTNMDDCSCLILLCGENTYQRKWIKYELELANQRGMGRLIIHLDGMKDRSGIPSPRGIDPYKYHGLYPETPSPSNYLIKSYSWVNDNGVFNIKHWVEDACKRAGK